MGRSSVDLNLFILISILFCFENVACESVQFYNCWKPSEKNVCTIHSVTVDPCPQAPKPCEYIKGKQNATIQFDFTPEFNSTNQLIGQAHKAALLQDLPLVGMDTDACKFTKCPLVAGVRNTYKFPMEIKAEYPEGAYTVKWKLWNEKEPIKEACCLKFKILLTTSN